MRLLAVDGNSVLNRAYYGIRLLSTKEGIYTNAIYGFLNMLLKIQQEVAPDRIAIAFDMKAPTFRHDKYEDYKAHRKPMPEELAQQLPILQELLVDLGYTIVKKEGWEADDILGTLAKACNDSGNECVIATGDRDSFQLVDNGVSVRLAFTKGGQPQAEIIDEQYIQDKYGVTPKQLIDVKALMGDASDNIPGVKGVGEKTALSLIQEFDTLDYIYENLDTIDIRPRVRANLTEGKEDAILSRKLALIDCAVPIETDIDYYKKEEVDNLKAYPMLVKLELFSLMERLGVRAPSEMENIGVETEESPLEIHFGKIPDSFLKSEKAINILFKFKKEAIKAVCVIDGNDVYYQDKDTDDTVKAFLESDVQKRTNMLKPLWHWAIEHGIKINGAEFDAEIAAYILNPSSNDYSLERLYHEYGIIPVDLDEEQAKKFPLIQDSIGFDALCDILESKIDENNQQSLLHDIEIPLAEVLASMEHIGIAVDSEGITNFGEGLQKDLDAVEKRIYEYAGEEFNINSPQQLSVILFEKLELPPKKKTKTGYSTNADVLDALKDKHPIISEVLEYRQLAKLKSTYVDGLLDVIQDDGRIHTTFQQTLTRTGRISSTEPNLQNIPIRTELGRTLRGFFVAADGCEFLDADYSQIELRVLADLSGDPNMIDAFKNNQDIHRRTAAQVFDMPLEMVTPLMRDRAKAVNFGIVYGIGAFSLSQDIGVSVKEADTYIKEYLAYYEGVQEYMDKVISEGTEQGYVSTMYNRRRYLPELSSSNYNMREFGKRVARNTPIQGTAADIIKIAMVRVYRKLNEGGYKSRLVLQVHDELIVESVPEEIEEVSELLKSEMENAAKLSVPLIADVKQGMSWLDAH